MSYKKSCWKCDEVIRIYYVHYEPENYQLSESIDYNKEEFWRGIDPDHYPSIGTWLIDNVPSIKKRYSKTKREESIVNVCKFCDNIQGNWFVIHDDDWMARAYGDYPMNLEKEMGVFTLEYEETLDVI